MGFLRISGNALPRVCSVLDELLSTTDGRGSGMAELVNDLIARGERIEVIYTSGGWCDVDSLEDVVSAAGL